ncbi:uncharacterized protein C1orf159 homolog isoform X3 [Pseudorca crassidens]|uniref:uncharacterized protein C1orf159 homolog isoform X3 n=1 Tax=Pseudorca crassidens TaxID=82174 RepID=UPI00352FB8EC
MALQRAVLLASLLVEVASRSSGSASCPHWHWPQLVGRTETPTSGSDSARSWLSQAGDTGVPGCGFWRCPAMCAHTQLLVLQDASSFDFQSHQLQVATNINNSTVEMPALCPPVAHKARGGGSTHDPGDPREKRRGCREAPRGGWAGSGGEDHPLPTRLLQPTPNRISGWAPRDPLRDSCLWESRCHGMRPGRSQPNFGCWFGHQTLAGHHVLSQGASVRCGRASSPRSGSARHSHRTLTTRGQSPRASSPSVVWTWWTPTPPAQALTCVAQAATGTGPRTGPSAASAAGTGLTTAPSAEASLPGARTSP